MRFFSRAEGDIQQQKGDHKQQEDEERVQVGGNKVHTLGVMFFNKESHQ
jgi:hypothetical protein